MAGPRGGVGLLGLGSVTPLTSLPPDLSSVRSLTIRPAVELQVRSGGKLGPGMGESVPRVHWAGSQLQGGLLTARLGPLTLLPGAGLSR